MSAASSDEPDDRVPPEEFEELCHVAYMAGSATLVNHPDLLPELRVCVRARLERKHETLGRVPGGARKKWARTVGRRLAVDILRRRVPRRPPPDPLPADPSNLDPDPGANPSVVVQSNDFVEWVDVVVDRYYGPVPEDAAERADWVRWMSRRLAAAGIERRLRRADAWRRVRSERPGVTADDRSLAQEEDERIRKGKLWRRRVGLRHTIDHLARTFGMPRRAVAKAVAEVNFRVEIEIRRDEA